MDQIAFDRFTRRLSSAESRRDALRLVLGMVFGTLVSAVSVDGLVLAAKKKKKRGGGKKGRRRDNRRANAKGNHRHNRRRGKKQKKKKNKKRNKPVATAPNDSGSVTPPPSVCTPTCGTTKPCGSDGCGDSCGGCAGDEMCQNGTCVCKPDCSGKACGGDGCGGQCPPGCPGSAPTCNAQGLCVGCVDATDCPNPGPCMTRRCVDGTCIPQPVTDGTQCGTNERCCGGSCQQCCSVADCTAPFGGTVECVQGFCNKQCDNPLHRVCGNNPGVCQQCCSDVTCSNIHPGSTCVNGQCKCPNGLTWCGMECVDTNVEPSHCGGCDNACLSGQCQNGTCLAPQTCGPTCSPKIGCDFVDCEGDQECEVNKCVCPAGTVDCDRDGTCESCGLCGVTCGPDPETGEPGFCCPDGRCSCGGTCCASGHECFVRVFGGEDLAAATSSEEICLPCADCWGTCCAGCINGECVHHQPPRGGSVRVR